MSQMDENGEAPSDQQGLQLGEYAAKNPGAIILDDIGFHPTGFPGFRSVRYEQFANNLRAVRALHLEFLSIPEDVIIALWRSLATWYFDHWSPADPLLKNMSAFGEVMKQLYKDSPKRPRAWRRPIQDSSQYKNILKDWINGSIENYLDSQALKYPGKFVTGFPIATRSMKRKFREAEDFKRAIEGVKAGDRKPKVKAPEAIMKEVERAMKKVNLDGKKPKVKAPMDIMAEIDRAMKKVNLDGNKPRRKRASKDIKGEMGICLGAPRHHSSLTRKHRPSKKQRLNNAKVLLGLSTVKKSDAEEGEKDRH